MRVNVTAKGKQIGKIYIFDLIPDTFCIIVNLKKKISSPFFYSHFDCIPAMSAVQIITWLMDLAKV